MNIRDSFGKDARVTLYAGDCRELLSQIPDAAAQLVVTSPPYNIGKRYERRGRGLDDYLQEQAAVIAECVRVLGEGGSICWEVGNHIAGPQEILPLDIALYPIFASHGLKLRNRIVWHFEHGLHCSKRFSGRYETILWFTKGNNYAFDLDPVRVPQKYPGKKQFKGPNAGKHSCNPLGKNPSDVWILPNVKHNHVEKTVHPCQFPVELVERLVLSLTHPGDLVVDPYMGVGTTAVAAVRHGRRTAGADTVRDYLDIARQRIELASLGLLKTRPMNKPVYEPPQNSSLVRRPTNGQLHLDHVNGDQPNGHRGVVAGVSK
jgi:adenine-specific DNA-methyltransferase